MQAAAKLEEYALSRQIEALWKEWYQPLYRWMLSKVRNSVLAEELVQETFVRVHKGLSNLQERERLSGWLFQIARHVVADHFRELQREQKTEAVATEWYENLDEGENNDDWLTEGLSLYLRELLKELPEPYQRPLEMVELEGMTQVQMANALGLNYSAARSRVQRGREKLKAMVAACCDVAFDRYGKPISCRCEGEDCF
jgi:RNA polymerase sigma-70 factor (ECF subfamily)